MYIEEYCITQNARIISDVIVSIFKKFLLIRSKL